MALALAVLAVLATVAPEQAVAQAESTLVGNAGQPTHERHTASFQGAVDHAQQFTTGPNAAGDTLTKVEFLSNDAQGHTFSALVSLVRGRDAPVLVLRAVTRFREV